MIYFLKKSIPSKKGLYLQIYINFYDPNTKKKNTKSYKSLGYVSDLIASGIEDPVSFYNEEVKKMNFELNANKDIQITDSSSSLFAGHFLVKAMFDYLDMDKTLNIIASNFKCRYNFSDIFKDLCYSQIISPGSKLKAFERVIPNLYNANAYSYDQVLDAINFIGSDYHKYIEMLNHHISSLWQRNMNEIYFDCTNYYFEIDLENDFLRKGPSKENRRLPLMGQALLLDADEIPLDTEFYPGNESEKPYLRNRVEDMKTRNNVTGRVIQVADKGLNCARNIYSAVVEANDGYIFSKAIRGKCLSKADKDWILMSDNDFNKWIDVFDANGELAYKYKTAKRITKTGKIVENGKYLYKCKINPEDEKETEFVVKEKRIVTFNPSLARKQRAEIFKEIDKLKGILSYKYAVKEEIGDASKYLNFEAKDKDGSKIKIATSLNQDKIDEDLAYCGYNMLITSEINAKPEDIYKTYHNLWRIEESFRVMKTYLEARPAFLSNEDSIKGHFLICYFSLTLLRLLELKIFDDLLPVGQIIDFIRQYKITKNYDESFINNSTHSKTFEHIKQKLGIAKLGNLYLSKRDVELLFQTELD
jgi:transposase